MHDRFIPRPHTVLLLVVFCALIVAVPAQARELESGTWSVGGDLDLTMAFISEDVEDQDDDDRTELNSSAQIGYFLIDNLEVGGLLNIDNSYTDDVDDTFYELGPFARYHHPLAEELNVFAIGAVGFAFGERDFENQADEDVTGYFMEVGGGLEYFFLDNVALDFTLTLGYDSLEFDSPSGDRDVERWTFANALGLTIYFSL